MVLELKCYCGKEGKRVRCSAVNGVGAAAKVGGVEDLLSCGEKCGRLLECGLHECGRKCHEGECGKCEVVRGKKCFCGKEEVEEGCGEMKGREEGRECWRPIVEGEEKESWVGEWSCKKVCEAYVFFSLSLVRSLRT